MRQNKIESKDVSECSEVQFLQRFGRWMAILSSPIDGEIMLGPNWFASVMGTGIIAIAGSVLPLKFPGLFIISSAAWAIAVILLVVLLVSIPMHWIRQPEAFKVIANDPISIQFFGAPPIALMTVGAATLLVGSHYVSLSASVAIDSALWFTGSIFHRNRIETTPQIPGCHRTPGLPRSRNLSRLEP